MADPVSGSSDLQRVRLAYLVSHPIQYQAPLLRRIAQEPDIDLTVFFGSDHSVKGYKDEGFGVEIAWDTPLLEGYRSEFLSKLRDTGRVSPLSPLSRGVYRRLRSPSGGPAFDALWVHGYASVNSLAAIVAAYALGIPVLLRAESWLADRSRSHAKLALKRTLLHDLRHLIAATLPIGTANAHYWRHYFGRDFPQFLMPYAVDNEWFGAKGDESETELPALRADLDLEPGRPVILFASKLQARKHCDHLLEAYHRLLPGYNAGSEPYLLIVGDGEQRPLLEARVKELGLRGVRFAGFQNQSSLPKYLRLADVFVLPSRHEPWGLIVNEAMAAGCPVVLSEDVGSATDLVSDGVEGALFPTGNIAALGAAITRVLARKDEMSQAARRRITGWGFEQDVAGLRAALAYTTRKIRP